MTMLGEFLNFRQEVYANMDTIIWGTSYVKHINRKWYNPMRYILGEEKVKRLDPRKIYIKKNNQSAAAPYGTCPCGTDMDSKGCPNGH